MKAQTKLMTDGNVAMQLLSFSLPLFIGNFFQQLYNTFDSFIVGYFLDSNALAAVSSAGNLIFFLVGFFMGLSMGASVVISNYIGAKDYENTQLAIHTTVALGLVVSIFLTVFGVVFSPLILRLMGTPEEVMHDSIVYFSIFFCGSLGNIMYSIFVGILRAAGDSKNPLYFLIISSILNIVLDVLFIGVFKMGVGAAAFATVIAQILSALLCLKLLLNAEEDIKLHISKIKFDGFMLKRIITYGVPSGIQNSVIGLANVVVQSNINYFGPTAMAGNGAYAKVEGFAFLPITSFTMAMTTFIGQNMGAKNYNRVKKGSWFGTVCSVILAEIIGIIFYVTAPYLIEAFDKNPETIEYGVMRARTCGVFYFLLSFTHAMSSILRGEGKNMVPMVIMLVCWCVIRVSILAVWGAVNKTIAMVNWVYPITWGLSSISFIFYYTIFNPLKKLQRQEALNEMVEQEA